MELTAKEIDAIMAQNAEFDRREVGGVIVAKGMHKRRVVPLANVSTDPKTVRHRPSDIMATEADGWTIQAFYHTHVRQSIEPSEPDRVGCARSGLPWIIVGYPNRRQCCIHPRPGRTPLEGRQFAHGTVDCYSLIRDYYGEIVGIELPDFYRPDDWWLRGENLYMEGLDKAGFDPMPFHEVGHDGIRQHDVLLMKFFPSDYRGIKRPNHGAVYLGASKMIHHFVGCLSQRTFYSQYYQRRTAFVARHRSLA